MRISVGAAPWSWGETKLDAFYRELARSPVDDVFLGEVACVRRACFSPEFVDRICGVLSEAGKTVYWSSPAVVTAEEERERFYAHSRRIGRIEINSPAFLAAARAFPAVAGSFLNVYNAGAARVLARTGVERIVLPPDTSREAARSIAASGELETEVVAHGHLALALSRDCHTARALARSGRNCGAVCRQHRQGMVLEAGHRPLFIIDGPETLSARAHCLVESLAWLDRAGVACIRIAPQFDHTAQIVAIYSEVLQKPGAVSVAAALRALASLSPHGLCNGWLRGKAGWMYEPGN